MTFSLPPFKGFPEGKAHTTPIPEAFFRQVLPHIDDLDELKLAVYIFWRLDHIEGAFRYLRLIDLAQDSGFLAGLDEDPARARSALGRALERLAQRGVLLPAEWRASPASLPETLYFLNSPKGRAALQAIQSGKWKPGPAAPGPLPVEPPPETPNIFRLYEENIGPLTPILAQSLSAAEDEFPASWIAEAIEIAVKNNKRTWRYIEAILNRWQREGKHDRQEKQQDRSDPANAGRKYTEGDYSEFVKH